MILFQSNIEVNKGPPKTSADTIRAHDETAYIIQGEWVLLVI